MSLPRPLRHQSRLAQVSSTVALLVSSTLLASTLTTAPASAAPAAPASSVATAAASAARAATLTIGGATRSVAGTNVARKVGKLVVYSAPRSTTYKTKRGVDVVVKDGKVVSVKRHHGRRAGRSAVPAGGFVVSGLGSSAAWLRAHAKPGAAVTSTPATGGQVGTGGRVVATATPTVGAPVVVGNGTWKLSGINVPRGVDQVVVYTAPVTVTTTNMWGVEVTVVGGKITSIVDRQVKQVASGTRVPTGGYVLSAHGSAGDWLRARAKVGGTVGYQVTVPDVVTPTPTPTPTPTTPSGDFAARVLALTNAARAQGQTCGTTAFPAVGALTYNAQLEQAAQGHAADMAAKNYFSHTSQDGRDFSQRITATGYKWYTIGENIAAGQTTPEAVVAGWLASEGHCRNIMNGSFKELGVGYAANASSSYRTYWVQDFGAR